MFIRDYVRLNNKGLYDFVFEDQSVLRKRMCKLSMKTELVMPCILTADNIFLARCQTDDSNILLYNDVPFHLIKYYILRLVIVDIPVTCLNQEIIITTDYLPEISYDAGIIIPWGTSQLQFMLGICGGIKIETNNPSSITCISPNVYRNTTDYIYDYYDISQDLLLIPSHCRAMVHQLSVPLTFHDGLSVVKIYELDALTNIVVNSEYEIEHITLKQTVNDLNVDIVGDGIVSFMYETIDINTYKVTNLTDRIYVKFGRSNAEIVIKLIEPINGNGHLQFDRVLFNKADRKQSYTQPGSIYNLDMPSIHYEEIQDMIPIHISEEGTIHYDEMPINEMPTIKWQDGGSPDFEITPDMACPISLTLLDKTIYRCPKCMIIINYECMKEWCTHSTRCPHCQSTSVSFVYYTR